MKCVEAQSLITEYINDELTGERLEQFLTHVYECEDCREELEIYYVIMKGMKQIDNDNVPNYNFHEAFEEELEQSKNQLVHSNTKFIIKLFLLEILIVVVAILLTMDNSKKIDSESVIDSFNGYEIESDLDIEE